MYTFRNETIRKELKIFFSRKGWKVLELSLENQYNIKANYLVQFLKNKVYSHQRRIPDRIYANALNHLFYEIEKLNIDLSEVVKSPAYAHLLFFSKR